MREQKRNSPRLSPRGIGQYRDDFGHVSSLPGEVGITILLALLYVPPRIFLPLTPVIAYSAIAAFFDVLIFGTALWVYLGLLRQNWTRVSTL